jgi:hypothetical protein
MIWKSYPNDRLCCRSDGFIIIKPIDSDKSIPLFCSICESLLRSREDEEAIIEFSCCHLCALAWAHSRRQEWKSGWRPSQDQVTEIIAARSPAKLRLILD